MIKKFGDDCDLKHALKINKNGIQYQNFISFCKHELNHFKSHEHFSKEALEQHYDIKFCRIRWRDNKLVFVEQPEWGNHVIFVEIKQK